MADADIATETTTDHAEPQAATGPCGEGHSIPLKQLDGKSLVCMLAPRFPLDILMRKT